VDLTFPEGKNEVPSKPKDETLKLKASKRLFFAAKYGNVNMGKIL
jgi:hypothetical protein